MATKNDAMPSKLSKIDNLTRPDHEYLAPEDHCYYWGEYHAKQGPKYGATNQLIWNLKKYPSTHKKPGYHYKADAIQRVGRAINRTVTNHGGVFTIVPVPPSKIPGDPDFDDRMLRVANIAVGGTQCVARELVCQTQGYQASHSGGDGHRLTPPELTEIYEIAANAPAPQGTVLVIDDVLTKGAHFRAMKDMIVQRFPGTVVVGLMVARNVHPVVSADDFEAL